MYHFSWDPNATTKFGLAPLLMEEEDGTLSTILSAGYWNRRETTLFLDVLADPRTTVVHDPQKDDVTVATNIAYLDRLVVILTYGHALLDHWKTKTNQIYCNLFLPLWTLEEASRASQLLRFEPIRTCGHLFDKYGGCIRGWLEGPCSTEESLVSKAQNVVTNHGHDLLGRTHDLRGAIAHVRVIFDETKPIPTLSDLLRANVVTTSTVSDDERNAARTLFNDFTKSSTEYVFGSECILETVDQANPSSYVCKRGQ